MISSAPLCVDLIEFCWIIEAEGVAKTRGA